MVKVIGKVFKVGNSYALTLRKALIDAEVLENGAYYELELIPKKDHGVKAFSQPWARDFLFKDWVVEAQNPHACILSEVKAGQSTQKLAC
jgi:hypothetical protein